MSEFARSLACKSTAFLVQLTIGGLTHCREDTAAVAGEILAASSSTLAGAQQHKTGVKHKPIAGVADTPQTTGYHPESLETPTALTSREAMEQCLRSPQRQTNFNSAGTTLASLNTVDATVVELHLFLALYYMTRNRAYQSQ